MTGGGTRPISGRMGQQSVAPAGEISEIELQRLDVEIEQQSKALDQMRRRKQTLDEEVAQGLTKLQKLQSQLKKTDMEIKMHVEQEKSLEKQIQSQRVVVDQSCPDEAQVAHLRDRLAACEKDCDTAQAAAAVVEDDVKRLNARILEISERLVGTIEKQLKQTKKEIELSTQNITKSEVAVKTSDRQAKKSEEKIENLKIEQEEVKQKIAENEIQLSEYENEAERLMQELETLKVERTESKKKEANLKQELEAFDTEEREIASNSMEMQASFEKAEKAVKEYTQKKSFWETELRKMKLHNLTDAVDRESTAEKLPTIPAEELAEINVEALKFQVSTCQERLNDNKSKINFAAVELYRKKDAAYRARAKELDEVSEEKEEAQRLHDKKKQDRSYMFLKGLHEINLKLKEMYQMITLGGDAELELVDQMDPFSEGVVFSVRPLKKSWKQISNLSGGEKTLSSLALVFALHHYKPTPFYMMDEIDAALDFRNVSIIANYIKERTEDAQFIIISLRNNMFELADRLVGIYKTYDCTKSVVIDPNSPVLRRTVISRVLPVNLDSTAVDNAAASLENKENETAAAIVVAEDETAVGGENDLLV